MSPAHQTLTLEEFLRLPETEPPSEYRDGRIEQKVSPKAKHGILQTMWAVKLDSLARGAKLGMAFVETRFTFAGHSTVPDVAFVVWDRIPLDPSGEVADEFFFAPDLEIEILSRGQSTRRLHAKLARSVADGVRLGWFIDPERKRATVFRPGKEPEELSAGTLDASPVLPGVVLALDEVFGWLRPERWNESTRA
jgi:Uma2 family endonuclease